MTSSHESPHHDWEKLSNTPYEYDGKDPMYLYVCLDCKETKIDF